MLFQILKQPLVSKKENLLRSQLPVCYYYLKSQRPWPWNTGGMHYEKKRPMSAKKFGRIFIPVTAVLLVLSLVVSGVMQYWSTVMDTVFGAAPISITPASGTENWNTDYYGLAADGMTKEQTALDGQALARVAEGEGIVLLKNQGNALPLTNDGAPLSANNSITVNGLGWSFYYPSLGGSGSGAVGSNDLVSPTEALAASNIQINQGLYDYYMNWSEEHFTDWQITKANGYYTDDDKNESPARPTVGKTYDAAWDVPELNAQEIQEACDSSNASDNSVQILWLGRGGGEYHDLPTVMSKEGGSVDKYGVNPDKHYLELTDEEECVLAKAKELRGSNGKIIVIVNANNVMELGRLEDDPQVDESQDKQRKGAKRAIALAHCKQPRKGANSRHKVYHSCSTSDVICQGFTSGIANLPIFSTFFTFIKQVSMTPAFLAGRCPGLLAVSCLPSMRFVRTLSFLWEPFYLECTLAWNKSQVPDDLPEQLDLGPACLGLRRGFRILWPPAPFEN